MPDLHLTRAERCVLLKRRRGLTNTELAELISDAYTFGRVITHRQVSETLCARQERDGMRLSTSGAVRDAILAAIELVLGTEEGE